MHTPWTDALPLHRLPRGTARVARLGAHPIALFHLDDGTLSAIDNRCPHEGYPLVQGLVHGCTLTCAWHNYKFDLRDGACLKGEEAVRAYPVRVHGEMVQVQLVPTDPHADRARHWRGLEDALFHGRTGQALREAARLLLAGVSPAELLVHAAAWDGQRGEYGVTHALPVAADLLPVCADLADADAIVPLAIVYELLTDSHARQPAQPAPDPVDPGPDPLAAGEVFRDHVEAEQLDAAEALLRGALLRGWTREQLEPWLFTVCADHFLGFGHGLIYSTKVFDLVERAPERAPDLLAGLVRNLVNSTREDLLPAWSGWRGRMAALELARPDAGTPSAADLSGATPALHDGPPPSAASASAPPDLTALRHALIDGPPKLAFDLLTEALHRGAAVSALCDALVLAAATRLLRFRVAIDPDPTVQEGWLFVTHQLTFASAVREALDRDPRPGTLRLLYQSLQFTTASRALDGDPPALPPAPPTATSDDVLRAVDRHDDATAIACALTLHAQGELHNLRDALLHAVQRDPAELGLTVAHLLKTTRVAFVEAERTGDLTPVLGTLRLWAHPPKVRRVYQAAREAIDLVMHGQVPRTLLP